MREFARTILNVLDGVGMEFKSLARGDVFKNSFYGDELFMKVSPVYDYMSRFAVPVAVKLSTGELISFYRTEQVIPVDGAFVNTRYHHD